MLDLDEITEDAAALGNWGFGFRVLGYMLSAQGNNCHLKFEVNMAYESRTVLPPKVLGVLGHSSEDRSSI